MHQANSGAVWTPTGGIAVEKQCLHACFTATERSGSPAAISSTILHIDDGRKKERERKGETENWDREYYKGEK